MSSEKTAEMFKNKSEEEIINWMIRNMSPEQIKSWIRLSNQSHCSAAKSSEVGTRQSPNSQAASRRHSQKRASQSDRARVCSSPGVLPGGGGRRVQTLPGHRVAAAGGHVPS